MTIPTTWLTLNYRKYNDKTLCRWLRITPERLAELVTRLGLTREKPVKVKKPRQKKVKFEVKKLSCDLSAEEEERLGIFLNMDI